MGLQDETQVEDIRIFEKRLLRSVELNREVVTRGWEAF